MLRDNNTLSGIATPDRPTPVQEYGGQITTSATTFTDRVFTGIHPSSIRYVDSAGNFLTPMVLKPAIELKSKPEKWPEESKVRIDAEFELATSTSVDRKYTTDFTLDVGEILSDAVVLLAAVTQTSQWSKRVIMTVAGVLKPFAKGNTVRFRAAVLHVNRPNDGYDSLTYTATFTVKSALINWYFQPRDYVDALVEQVVQETRPLSDDLRPPPRRKTVFRFLRAMLSPLRSTHT